MYYGNNDFRDYLQTSGDYLEHYQREGAHWGIRNGPPYPLNKEGIASFKANLDAKIKARKDKKRMAKLRAAKAAKRAASEKEAQKQAKQQDKAKKFSLTTGRTSTKEIKKLSDEELRTRINRLNMEKQLRDLEKNDISSGQKIIENALKAAGEAVITNAFKKVGNYYVDQLFGAISEELKNTPADEKDEKKDKKQTDKKQSDNKKNNQNEGNKDQSKTSSNTYYQYNFYGNQTPNSQRNRNDDVIDTTGSEITTGLIKSKKKKKK